MALETAAIIIKCLPLSSKLCNFCPTIFRSQISDRIFVCGLELLDMGKSSRVESRYEIWPRESIRERLWKNRDNLDFRDRVTQYKLRSKILVFWKNFVCRLHKIWIGFLKVDFLKCSERRPTVLLRVWHKDLFSSLILQEIL
jgi:hypothetical protein